MDKQLKKLNELWHRGIHLMMSDALQAAFPNMKALSTLEIGVISNLSKDPDIRLLDIAKHLSIPKSTLTSVINRMEKKGLVERKTSESDRRSYRLVLTVKGKGVQVEHQDYEKMIGEMILSGLDDENERTEFLKKVEKILDHMDSKKA